jgi:hypothetical protein
MKAMYQCLGISFKIVDKEFRANVVVLDSKGIDIILGMGWLSKVDAYLVCQEVSDLSGIDPLGTARKLPVKKKKSDSY